MYAPIPPAFYQNFLKPPLDPLVTFSRSSAGYRVNEKGLLESVASGVPRFDHWPFNGTAGQNGQIGGLLIEGARTNLLTYSDDLTNGAWTKGDCTISAAAVAAPEAGVSADKLVEDASNASHRIARGSITASGAHVASVLVKAAGRNYAMLELWNGTTAAYAGVNLSTGVKDGASSSGAIVEPLGDGWYRISVPHSLTGSGNSYTVYAMNASGLPAAYVGDGSSGIYAIRGQLEAASTPGKTIPTTSGTVTRAADAATVALSSLPAWNASAGTAFVDVLWPGDRTASEYGLLNIDDGTYDNTLEIVSHSSGGIAIRIRSGGGTVAAWTFSVAPLPAAGESHRVALAWALNDAQVAHNGVVDTADSSCALPIGLTTLRLGAAPSGINQFGGALRQAAIFPRRFTSAELQRLTA